jgi:hypothetical protein
MYALCSFRRLESEIVALLPTTKLRLSGAGVEICKVNVILTGGRLALSLNPEVLRSS